MLDVWHARQVAADKFFIEGITVRNIDEEIETLELHFELEIHQTLICEL